MNRTERHLKQHVVFYLGLLQLIAGYFAADGDMPTVWMKRALALSGVLTLIVKYVKDSLPEDDAPQNPTLPAPPAQEHAP